MYMADDQYWMNSNFKIANFSEEYSPLIENIVKLFRSKWIALIEIGNIRYRDVCWMQANSQIESHLYIALYESCLAKMTTINGSSSVDDGGGGVTA